MTRTNAIELIVDDPAHQDAYHLVCWKYFMERKEWPTRAQLRTYLTDGHGTFDDMWTMMLKHHPTYLHKERAYGTHRSG